MIAQMGKTFGGAGGSSSRRISTVSDMSDSPMILRAVIL